MEKRLNQFKALYYKLVVELRLPQSGKRAALWLIDALVLLAAILIAFWTRFGEAFQPPLGLTLLIASFPVIGLSCLVASGFYKQMVRFSGENLLFHVMKSVTMATVLWVMLGFVTKQNSLGMDGASRSVPLIFWTISVVALYAMRWSFRHVYWSQVNRQASKAVLLYGAGQNSYRLSRALKHEPNVRLVGVVDSASERQGRVFYGVRVYGPEALPSLVERYQVAECIVAVDNPDDEEVREFVAALERNRVKPRILPPFVVLPRHQNLVKLVREIDVADLLGRKPVAPQPALLNGSVEGKVVLVTGAGGSIGSELCRQICQLGPTKLVLLDHSEPALYQINRQLVSTEQCEVVSVLGSVKDSITLKRLFELHCIQTIYHAAAHKHVPLLESNLAEGFANNVLGTQTVAEFALQYGVERFVLISSDKAVRPTNVMGSTKRWAEIAIQNIQTKASALIAQGKPAPVFCAVRFGNVLGSSGSVIPLFKEQIASGGPVTVTHPEVTRFFMSISEAAELVLQASTLAKGGDVFLLDMGKSVKIVDLAKNLIYLAGLTPKDPQTGEGDVAIEFIGLRPGEKLFEELLIETEGAFCTEHKKILKAKEPFPSEAIFQALIKRVSVLLERGEVNEAKELIISVANKNKQHLEVLHTAS